MSQDYFLSRLYESLIKNRQPATKSTFQTLTELYGTIYEQEPTPVHGDFGKEVQPDVPPEETVTQAPPPTEPVTSSDSIHWNKDSSQTTLVSWTPLQAAMYRKEDAKTGAGPGEYSVASVISNTENEEILQKMISGSNKSFDVSYPAADNPDSLRFEVKQEEIAEEEGAEQSTKDVRIAKLGTTVANKIIKDVEEIALAFKDEYDLLDPENQKTINEAILDKLEKVKEPQIGVTKTGRQQLQPGAKEKRRYEKQLTQRQQWTVDKFINAIGTKNGELTFTYLFEDLFQKRKQDRMFRGMYPLMSLEKLIDICDGLTKGEAGEGEEDESTERVQTIKKTFKQFYGTSSEEKNRILDNTFEKEAEGVDKRLTKAKIKQVKEGGKSAQEFFKDIKKEKLNTKIKELKEYIENPETVRSMFPDGKNDPVTIQGLFVVDPKGWKYVTSSDIGKSIAITRISMGKPKIIIKK